MQFKRHCLGYHLLSGVGEKPFLNGLDWQVVARNDCIHIQYFLEIEKDVRGHHDLSSIHLSGPPHVPTTFRPPGRGARTQRAARYAGVGRLAAAHAIQGLGAVRFASRLTLAHLLLSLRIIRRRPLRLPEMRAGLIPDDLHNRVRTTLNVKYGAGGV
jgi:hypothetical protein